MTTTTTNARAPRSYGRASLEGSDDERWAQLEAHLDLEAKQEQLRDYADSLADADALAQMGDEGGA